MATENKEEKLVVCRCSQHGGHCIVKDCMHSEPHLPYADCDKRAWDHCPWSSTPTWCIVCKQEEKGN